MSTEESYANAYFGTANGITAFAVAQMILVMVTVGSVNEFQVALQSSPVLVMAATGVMTVAYLSGVIACHHVEKHLLRQVSDQLARRLRWTFWVRIIVISVSSAFGIIALVCIIIKDTVSAC